MKRYIPFNFEEARRNPEMNPHIGAWDYVDKYKDDEDVYISFTEIDKIGINPRSKYNTPVGIYTYPLKEFAEKYIFGSMSAVDEYNKLHIKNTVGSYAPFAGNAKYINFIRLKDKSHFINDMYKDYGSNDYDRDIKILEKKYKTLFSVDENTLNNLTKEIWNFMSADFRLASTSGNSLTTYELMVEVGYIIDQTLRDVSSNTVTKTVYAFEDDFKKLLAKPDKIQLEWIISLILELLPQWDNFITSANNSAKSSNPVMMMWNITRLLAEKLSNNAKQASTKWNLILSKDLGYSGFADKSSKGYIHLSEPMQAVFFNTRAFEVITRVENVPAKRIIGGPLYKKGDAFRDNKSRVIYTIKGIRPPTPMAKDLEYRISSSEGNNTFTQTYIQQLLKDGDWRKVD